MKPNKYIIIESHDQSLVTGAVKAFADLYHGQEFSKSIKLYCLNSGSYIVAFDTIDHEHFLYAVNYLYYPETKAKFSSVLGYSTGNKEMFFIPANDREYDNCFSVNRDGVVTKHTFDGSKLLCDIDITYKESQINLDSVSLVETIECTAPPKKKGFFSWLFA